MTVNDMDLISLYGQCSTTIITLVGVIARQRDVAMADVTQLITDRNHAENQIKISGVSGLRGYCRPSCPGYCDEYECGCPCHQEYRHEFGAGVLDDHSAMRKELADDNAIALARLKRWQEDQ